MITTEREREREREKTGRHLSDLTVIIDLWPSIITEQRPFNGARARENSIRHITHNIIDKPIATNNSRLPECSNHHCWPPMINHRQ